jgi:hypothetical protein
MSKPVNDVRVTSTDERYAGITFSGAIAHALKQAKAAPDHGLPDADLRAPANMSRDRAALLGFLRLLPASPLGQTPGIPFSVLSAEKVGNRYNAKRTANLRAALQDSGLQFTGVVGSYKGDRENGFVVLTPTVVDRMMVTALAAEYEQESILHVDAKRLAVLHYFETCQDVTIGIWASVSSVEGLDSWTLANGQYYAVRSKHSKFSVEYAIEQGFIAPTAENLTRPALLQRQAE